MTPRTLTAVTPLLIAVFSMTSLGAPIPPAGTRESGATLKAHRGGGALWLAFSPDSKILATAGGDNLIKLWDVATAKEIIALEGHSDRINTVVFSPDGKSLASASQDLTIRIWDVAGHKQTASIKNNRDYVECLIFKPDSKTLVFTENKAVKRWDTTGNQLDLVSNLPENLIRYGALASEPPDKLLAITQKEEDKKTTLTLWDAMTGKEIRTFKGHTSAVYGVALSPDRKVLASCANDRTLRLWDVASGKNTATITYDGMPCCVAFSPDGKIIACGTRGNGNRENVQVRLIDVATGKELAALLGHTYLVLCIAFSPDGKTLASMSGAEIKLWTIPATIQAPDK